MFRWNRAQRNQRDHATSHAITSVLLASALLTPSAVAQDCVKRVHTNLGAPGLADAGLGIVNSVEAWDPDGPGPRGQVVIVAGSFGPTVNAAAGMRTHTVATWDPATGEWGPLPGTHVGTAFITQVLRNNHFLIGMSGGAIYRWDGSGSVRLDGLATGTGRRVYTFAELPGGDVIAGGLFTFIDGQPASNIARFDGESWKPFESGVD